LSLVRSITFTFSSTECMNRLYITLVRSKLEYKSAIQLSQLMPISWNALSRRFRPTILIVFFLKSITAILLLWRSYNCALHVWGGIALMHFFLFKFTLVLYSVLFWKLLVFEFLLGVSETLLSSILTFLEPERSH
jgi:hypothetical protein